MDYTPTPAMVPFLDRLAKGAQALDLSLSRDQALRMTRHAAELILWNKKVNLTAIRDPLDMAEKHFADALATGQFLDPGNSTLLDLGSGGGFPGIPLKIMNPGMGLMMVDASRKKVNFLKQVIRVLDLENADAVHARVESLHHDPGFAGQYDAVISRGFAELSKFVDLALPLLKPHGDLFAMKGENAGQEITPDLRDRFHIHTDHYRLPFEKADRYLIRLGT